MVAAPPRWIGNSSLGDVGPPPLLASSLSVCPCYHLICQRRLCKHQLIIESTPLTTLPLCVCVFVFACFHVLCAFMFCVHVCGRALAGTIASRSFRFTMTSASATTKSDGYQTPCPSITWCRCSMLDHTHTDTHTHTKGNMAQVHCHAAF